ncbi:MAG: GNAT family N-acetyltransferase [Firmicutes bacterium]|nr:GNAT family N-acetyltransferase [Bacillota bacterium]
MKYYKKIIGKRIYLSPMSADDVDIYIKWMNENVARSFGQYPLVVSSKSDLNWFFEPPTNMQRYAIVLLDGDVMIGSISIHNIDHLNRNAFLGIFIGEKEHRSKGYGAEAILLILAYGFNTLNLHNIMLSVDADNVEGIACYKKVGFREVGRRREWVYKDGKYIDRIYMDMLACEFQGIIWARTSPVVQA